MEAELAALAIRIARQDLLIASLNAQLREKDAEIERLRANEQEH